MGTLCLLFGIYPMKGNHDKAQDSTQIKKKKQQLWENMQKHSKSQNSQN